jgi:hypothetical protein
VDFGSEKRITWVGRVADAHRAAEHEERIHPVERSRARVAEIETQYVGPKARAFERSNARRPFVRRVLENDETA